MTMHNSGLLRAECGTACLCGGLLGFGVVEVAEAQASALAVFAALHVVAHSALLPFAHSGYWYLAAYKLM